VVEARQGGALDGVEPTQDVAEHLEACAQCQSDVETMAELLSTLGQLEQPPIPADVALRIDAALAEAARTSATLGLPTAASGITVTHTADTSTGGEGSDVADSEASSATRPAAGDHPAASQLSPEAGTSSAAPGDGEHLVGSRPSSGGSPASRSDRRPPSLGPGKRHPDSQRPASRRSLRRALGWTVASLVLLGGAAGLATAVLSSGGSTSGASASGVRGTAPFPPENSQPLRNNGAESGNGDALTALASWTKSALAASSPASTNAGPSEHPHALTTAPTSAVAAAAIAQCLANPATQGRQVLGTSYGVFLGKSAVLVVYAIGDGSQTVDSVAYQAPCASTDYLILAEGTVPK
jgi:hypothetical protein